MIKDKLFSSAKAVYIVNLRRFCFVLALGMFYACGQNAHISIKDKKMLLDSFSCVPCPDYLAFGKQLDSIGISSVDVYKYSYAAYDTARLCKLINSVCWNAENYNEVENKDYFPSILYDLEKFAPKILKLKQPHHKTFLDVGAGNGEKMYAALCLHFEKVYGIEYSHKNCQLLEMFLRPFIDNHKAENICADAFDVKDEFYSSADFIYMFSPISNNDLMAKLYLKIMNAMQNGTIFLEVRFVYYNELRIQSNYSFPHTVNAYTDGFALKKENNLYFYSFVNSEPLAWKKLDVK